MLINGSMNKARWRLGASSVVMAAGIGASSRSKRGKALFFRCAIVTNPKTKSSAPT